MEIVDGTPLIEIRIENPLLSTSFPEDGSVLALIDTGFEGFAIVPEEVFRNARFSELKLIERNLLMPDKRLIKSVGAFGRIIVTSLNTYRDGFIETSENVEEVVLGAEFLRGFRITLDYCAASVSIDQC
ncbi:clan AA aspartic protease, AF_0612 family [Geoglobus ahangari]|uniref:Clan AA aspartic protease, AF_0612 family n=1 Tax=Geoglobus ahangari TaxID=113653 RepID=A0A0F7IEH2_9EURY|nr:clan AA aspartic protease [Geoglobus ahangari]AKG91092.1 clan AA aspartic protease, AF_0612 family [Geoglobus ahangari]